VPLGVGESTDVIPKQTRKRLYPTNSPVRTIEGNNKLPITVVLNHCFDLLTEIFTSNSRIRRLTFIRPPKAWGDTSAFRIVKNTITDAILVPCLWLVVAITETGK
jgi:hypothetical protein